MLFFYFLTVLLFSRFFDKKNDGSVKSTKEKAMDALGDKDVKNVETNFSNGELRL